MPLFEVPDWNAPSSVQPSVQSAKPSRKRKRSASEEDMRLDKAAFNFEKLVKQLEGGSTSPKEKKKARNESLRSEKKAESASSKADRRPEAKKERKRKEKEKPKERPSNTPEDNTVMPLKKKRQKDNKSEQTPVVAEDKPKPQNLSKKSEPFKGHDLTPLQSKMKATLDGARFRCVSREAWMMNYR